LFNASPFFYLDSGKLRKQRAPFRLSNQLLLKSLKILIFLILLTFFANKM